MYIPFGNPKGMYNIWETTLAYVILKNEFRKIPCRRNIVAGNGQYDVNGLKQKPEKRYR